MGCRAAAFARLQSCYAGCLSSACADSCNAPTDHQTAFAEYALMRDGLNASGRPVCIRATVLFGEPLQAWAAFCTQFAHLGTHTWTPSFLF